MHRILCIFLLSLSSIGFCQKNDSLSQPLVEVIKYNKLMGSTFVLTVIDSSYDQGNAKCNQAMDLGRQIEAKMSSWNRTSQTSKINKFAGIIPVKVDIDLYNLISRSLKISKLTDGAFDISYASLDKVWDFSPEPAELPTIEQISQALLKVNYKDILLNEKDTTVFLKNPGMKIGFGAIGKGYLADEIKKFLISEGIQSGIVNAGGDLITWGNPLNDTAWDIGIANPKFRNSVMGNIKIRDKAIVTSGDYEKFITIDGKNYCHIINPKTGYPVELLNSVTVICKSAELADALATAIFVMGEKEGIDLINQLKGIEAVVIKEEEIFATKNLEIDKYKTIVGEYKFYADYGAFKPCGTNKWIAITFPDQSYANELYNSTLDGQFNMTALITVKGKFSEEKRESKTIKVFQVSKLVKMEMKNCN